MGATCTLSCHPEDDHHDVHHHPAVADGDHPYQGHLKEVQGQCGGEVQVQYKQPYTGDAVTVMLVYSFSERKKNHLLTTIR